MCIYIFIYTHIHTCIESFLQEFWQVSGFICLTLRIGNKALGILSPNRALWGNISPTVNGHSLPS